MGLSVPCRYYSAKRTLFDAASIQAKLAPLFTDSGVQRPLFHGQNFIQMPDIQEVTFVDIEVRKLIRMARQVYTVLATMSVK